MSAFPETAACEKEFSTMRDGTTGNDDTANAMLLLSAQLPWRPHPRTSHGWSNRSPSELMTGQGSPTRSSMTMSPPSASILDGMTDLADLTVSEAAAMMSAGT